eukprot:11201912-Lingulodinium_polyedra.AAC.1
MLVVRCPARRLDDRGIRIVDACLHGRFVRRSRGCGKPRPHGRWLYGRDCPDCQIDDTPIVVPSQSWALAWPSGSPA